MGAGITAGHGGPNNHSRWICPEGTACHGEHTQEPVYPEGLQPTERTHTGAGEKREEEQQR